MKKAFGSSAFNSNAFLTRLLIHMGLLKVRCKAGRRERGGAPGAARASPHPSHTSSPAAASHPPGPQAWVCFRSLGLPGGIWDSP